MKQVANFSFITKLSFIFILAVVAFSGQKSFAQEIITLQQAVDKTLNNNLQVRQSKLSESLAEETLNQSKLALYPTLNGSVNTGLSFGQSRDQNTFQVINQKFMIDSAQKPEIKAYPNRLLVVLVCTFFAVLTGLLMAVYQEIVSPKFKAM